MATKKLAFGGMSNMRSKVKQMAPMAKRPQARAIDNKNAPSMEQLMAAKQAMLGNQKGQSQNSSPMGAKLAAQMADQRARQEKLANAAQGAARAQMPMKKYEPQPTGKPSTTQARPTPVAPMAKRPQAPANRTQAEADMAARQALNTAKQTAQQMSTQKQLQDARNAPATSRAPRAPTGKPSTTPAATALKGLKSVAPTMYGRLTGTKMKAGGMAHSDVKMDKKVVKKAVGMHEKQLHGGKKSDMTKLKSGGSIDGCAIRGKTKTSMVKMKKGGAC